MKFHVTLAICHPDHTWSPRKVDLDDDAFLDAEYGHTEGEIWEAAHDQVVQQYDPRPIAIGLVDYETEAEEGDEEYEDEDEMLGGGDDN